MEKLTISSDNIPKGATHILRHPEGKFNSPYRKITKGESLGGNEYYHSEFWDNYTERWVKQCHGYWSEKSIKAKLIPLNVTTLVYSSDGELFNSEKFEEGHKFVGTRREIDPNELISLHEVDTILESLEEQLYDICGEAAIGSLHCTEAGKVAIRDALKGLVQQHVEISCYAVDKIEEIANEETASGTS